jgi:hypothetical protein
MEIKVIEDRFLVETIGCGGYVTSDGEIHIDKGLTDQEKRFLIIHEVLDMHLGSTKTLFKGCKIKPKKGIIKHSKIDKIAIDIIDALQQIGGIE